MENKQNHNSKNEGKTGRQKREEKEGGGERNHLQFC